MWWWIGNVVLIAVVIPLVLVLAVRLLEPILEIRRYVRDIHERTGGIERELAVVAELDRTRAFMQKSREYVERYADAVGQGGA